MREFNEALFKTKVDNIFVKIHTAIMQENLEEVKHFLSDDLYLKLTAYLNELASKNVRQIYDEINVKNTFIKKRTITNDKEIVEVNLTSRYMDYIIDKETGTTIKGDDKRRVEKNNYLVFEKKLNVKADTLVKHCPGCGASLSVNTTGKCSYCGRTFDLENYDYILVAFNKD